MSTATRRLPLFASCLAASLTAAILTGCSGSVATTSTTPPPTAGSLTGTYVLSANGNDATDGLYGVAGVLSFDGLGHVTSGVADYNLGSGVDMNVQLTGTYTVASSTALVSLTDGFGTQDTFSVSVSGSAPFTISAFDGSGTGTLTAESVATSFATAGTYTYSLSGQGNNALTSTGGFTVAAGTITAGTQTDTDGTLVSNYAAISGILEPVQLNGRGQAAIGPYTFSYYPVSTSQIVLIGLDNRALLYGTATKM